MRRRSLLHPDEADVRTALGRAIDRGTREHYADAEQYDHEYGRRREDVTFYLDVAAKVRGPILELGSGTGRLTVPLARAGHQVVGVDASPQMLGRCAARLERAGAAVRERVTLHRADFRGLADPRSPLGRRRFDLIVCPFNAFQHLYELDDVERFLAGVRGHLSAKGRFVFDVMNPDLRWLSRDPKKRWGKTRYKDPRTRAEMVYSTTLAYDGPLQIAFMTIHYDRLKGSRSRRVHLTHRHFFPRELEALLFYNGLSIVRREGDFDGDALTSTSEQQVLFCKIDERRPRRKIEGSR